MPPRSEEPRRDATGSRRGSSRGASGPPRPAGERSDEPGLGGISDARAYTPRGRTLREDGGPAAGRAEQRRTPRGGRSQDPFRPALQVLDGGRSGAARAGNRQAGTTRRDGGAGRTTVVRTVTGRPPRDESANTARRGSGARESRPTRQPRSGGAREPRRGDRPPARRPSRRRPTPPRLADPRRRLRLGTALAMALFVAIGVRLVVLQAVDTPAYADGGVADRLRTVQLPAPRGAIYDRDGAALAHSVEARYVFADPTEVEDVEATARTLSPLLGVAGLGTRREDAPPQAQRRGLASSRTWPGGWTSTGPARSTR